LFEQIFFNEHSLIKDNVYYYYITAFFVPHKCMKIRILFQIIQVRYYSY